MKSKNSDSYEHYKDEDGVSSVVAAARRIAHARFSHYYKVIKQDYDSELRKYKQRQYFQTSKNKSK